MDFFSHFIPTHTVDLSKIEEVNARLDITKKFLERFPISDLGFEIVFFPKNANERMIEKQVLNFQYLKESLEGDYPVKVHASLHFPSTGDMTLFLGTNEPSVRQTILDLSKHCGILAAAIAVDVIVIHTGGNVTMVQWERMKKDNQLKKRSLDATAGMLKKILDSLTGEGYTGKLAWENMPYPFDIPAFTFTNMILPDFIHVWNNLQENGMNLQKFGICDDLCHSWIISRAARYYASLFEETGNQVVPPGFLDGEWKDFIDLSNPITFTEAFLNKVIHVHVADSKGEFNPVTSPPTQPTEGDQLGTGDFTRDPVFVELFERIGSKSHQKIMCTLEVKDSDFLHPIKAFKSLLYLGERFLIQE